MSGSNVIKFLEGPRLYLRPLVEQDVDGPYVEWLNDEAVCRGNSHHVYPYSRRQALDYIQSAGAVRDAVILAIALKDGDRHIGNISLSSIHRVYRSAEFAILIGDKQAWGQGYATEAGHLLVAHGFRAMNLRRIACGTFETNAAMCKLALALGMKEEGRRRQAAFTDGEHVDVIEYGVLREEFEARQ